MKEAEIRRLSAANLLCVLSVILTAVVPPFFWDGFTVLGTHLAWLCVCSVCVSTLNIILHLLLKPNLSPKRISFAHKVRILFLNCYQTIQKGSKLFHWNNQIRKQADNFWWLILVFYEWAVCSTFWNKFSNIFVTLNFLYL